MHFRKSYEMCRPLLKNEKHLEALDSRYEMLCKYMHFAKQTVRSNTVYVFRGTIFVVPSFLVVRVLLVCIMQCVNR